MAADDKMKDKHVGGNVNHLRLYLLNALTLFNDVWKIRRRNNVTTT